MKYRLRIEFIINFNKISKFFDLNKTKSLTTLQPKVTLEQLTDDYKE